MPRNLTVSMYNVGFGDCFVVSLPPGETGRRPRILIDCGSIKTATSGISKIVDRVIDDASEDGEPHFEVIAMSHRHRDHISGFAHPRWSEVRVDEVWMPWTEGPDPVAQDLRLNMAESQKALIEEFVALQQVRALSDSSVDVIEHVMVNSLIPDGLLGEMEDRADSGGATDAIRPSVKRILDASPRATNEDAMATLHRGFLGGTRGAERLFLSAEDGSFHTPLLPAVDVHVLGPSTSEEVIRRMRPPSTESFLRAVDNPYRSDVRLPFQQGRHAGIPDVDDSLKDLLHRVSDEATVRAAAAFERAVNNTSLFLALEVGTAVLVFPGDSQWGSWEAVLEDREKSDLLRRTRFYKVGHHGSHNSTPASFVGLLGSEFWAATSVQPHGSFSQIPRGPLLDKLREKLAASDHKERVVRSDSPPEPESVPEGVEIVDEDRIDFHIPID